MTLAFALALTCVASTAAGQTSASEPGQRQMELNTQAVEAMEAGRYSLAINLLEESVSLGALNVTYLNMGRAYQLMGRCEQAKATYAKVAAAAAVDNPPPSFINKKTREYLAQLPEDCKADDEQQGEMARTEAGRDPGAVRIVVRREPPNLKPWAWASTATGTLALAGSLGMHLWARSIRSDLEAAQRNEYEQVTGVSQADAFERQNTADSLDTAALATAITGAVFVGTGAYLFVTDATYATEVGIAPTASGVQFVLSGQF